MCLADDISSHPLVAEELPLIHTSRCEFLPEIVGDRALQPRHCDVFSQSLIYLFYGRPAYRSTRGARSGDPMVLCPVCFVFKPQSIPVFKDVYACDTGAVANGIFEPDIHPSDLPSLKLPPQIESARRCVDLLFGGNRQYFFGTVATGKTFDPDGVASRFYSLQLKAGPSNYDDRKGTIEVQVAQPAPLAGSLLFVVLPREFLDDPAIREALLVDWNCDPIPYPTFRGSAPQEYYSVVRNEVTRRFEGATRI